LPCFSSLFDSVSAKFGLAETDFTDVYEGKQWNCPATQTIGFSSWFAEASPKYLTGVSRNFQAKADGSEALTINVWMGPSYPCPHMLLTFGKQADGSCFVEADYVARGSTTLDSDPGYVEKYYGPEVIAHWDEANTRSGAFALAPSVEFMERLLYSPARISIGGLSTEDAAAIAERHVNTFLSWLDDAQQVPARSRGSFNLRDDKLRQFFYRAEVVKRCKLLGPDLGMIVAACNTGPTAEAYVGGGS